MKTKIVWFRNDLRVHDNPCLTEALQKADKVLPVYIFDPRQFEKGKYGFLKTGSFRARFLLQSVQQLRANLQQLGANLMVLVGKPEEELPKLAVQYQAGSIYFSKEATPEEVEVEELLIKALSKVKCDGKTFWTSTLISLEDLPFPLSQTPPVFTKFRKTVEFDLSIQEPLKVPSKVEAPDASDWGNMPTLRELQLPDPPHGDARNAFPYQGGENQGLARVKEYIWEKDLLKAYYDSRNGLMGTDYSSKLSAWLSCGCLSPRYVYAEIKRYEQERVENKSTYWLVFELLWRDFFHFTAAKHYERFFAQNGYNGTPKKLWDDDWEKFEKWQNGDTGQDFVDANMRELKHTGFMSNRGRQNVASYLIHDLNVNWLMGAEYFESMLIDHDVCSNYGNWSYLAGIGSDPRGQRVFDVEKQASEYDPSGAFRRLWLS